MGAACVGSGPSTSNSDSGSATTEPSTTSAPDLLTFVGVLEVDDASASNDGPPFLYALRLERSGGNDYSGTAVARALYTDRGGDAGLVETAVQATLQGSTLSFQETGVRSNGRIDPWCLVGGEFVVGAERATGTWSSDCGETGSVTVHDRGLEWYDRLPDCPCFYTPDLDGLEEGDGTWRRTNTGVLIDIFHPGADLEIRWSPVDGGAGQQCTYQENEKTGEYELITGGLAAGTPDVFSPVELEETLKHLVRDVVPLAIADCATYFEWFPPNNDNACTLKVVNAIDEATTESCIRTLFSKWFAALSSGDPHLTTFDGLRYDMQGVGEFVLARSLDDDLEVQTRTAPWRSRTSVAVNTAVALRVAGDRVGLYPTGDGDLEVWINGAPATQAPEHPLSGGGRLVWNGPVVNVEWPDGTVLSAARSRDFVNVQVLLSTERAGRVEGLLGNANEDALDDLVRTDGTPLEINLPFRSFYDDYVMDWRVTDETSLFDYGEGESTATFTDLLFPWRPINADDLDATTRAQAEATCLDAGVRAGSSQLQDCILDVGLTGEPAFAEAAAHPLDAQASVALSSPADSAPQALIVAPIDGDQLRPDVGLTFEARVADDLTPTPDLVVGWESSIDGALSLDLTVDDAGRVSGTGPLSVGIHMLTFFAEDAGGQRTTTPAIPVTVARELPDCAEVVTLDIEASCADIDSAVDGIYAIDPDGLNQGADPVCTYCAMTIQGGGWTLFAHHQDGVAERIVADPVTTTTPGVMGAAAWAALRDGMQEGMLFVDEHGTVSFLSAATLAAGSCSTPSDVTDLTGVSRLSLWHDEDVGCAITGLDYSVVSMSGSDYPLYTSAGASLFMRSQTSFDTWGYGSADASYPAQDTLLFYLK